MLPWFTAIHGIHHDRPTYHEHPPGLETTYNHDNEDPGLGGPFVASPGL